MERSRVHFWTAALGVVALDQLTKFWVERALPLNGDGIPLPLGVTLRHVHNPGVAFGQLSQAGPLLIVAALLAAAGILAYRVRLSRLGGPVHPLLNIGLALPWGGAVGNLVDRLRLGKVVDFFDLGWFPVFNLADSAITVGAVLLGVFFLFLAPRDHAASLPPEPLPDACPASASSSSLANDR